MQTPGTYISAIGHVGLIGWLILGWGLSSEPLPFEVAQVSVVSGDEYAAIVAASTPNPNMDAPSEPVAPAVEEAPAPPVDETPPAPADTPAPVAPPVAETPPPAPPAPPEAPAEVVDVAPVQPTPPAVADPDLTVSPRPSPRPVPRIAPEAVAPPPPDAAVADVVQEAVVPDETVAAEVAEPAVAPTAPEEAATEIVIEDVVPSGAVATSVRPKTRPNRPAPAPETPSQTVTAPQTPAQTTSASSDNAADAAVEAALAAAMASASSPNVAAGPPMTGSEKEGFRVAVNACWNVDPGSQAARVTMTVGFRLSQDGKVEGDVRQISATGGDDGAVRIAYDSARRAILRCGASGYDLPADKYDQWRDVEITFDPSGMRMR